MFFYLELDCRTFCSQTLQLWFLCYSYQFFDTPQCHYSLQLNSLPYIYTAPCLQYGRQALLQELPEFKVIPPGILVQFIS